MSTFREENVRLRIESISDLPTVADQLEHINDMLKSQNTILAQSQAVASAQSGNQITAINAVTDALKKQTAAQKQASSDYDDLVKNTQKQFDSAADSVRSFTTLVAGAFAVSEIKAFGQDVIDAKTKIDSVQISLQTMLGSKKEADELYAQIVDLAKKTPFTLQEVSEQVTKLKAYNIETADLIPTITALGNISAAVGAEKLPQLTLAYGQVANAQKLMGTELKQFTEAGVPLLDLIAKSYDKTKEEVIQMAAQHEISFAMVRKAILDASQEGGKYQDLMAKLSTTVGGQISNMADQFFIAKGKIGDFFEDTIRGGTSDITDLIQAVAGSNSAIARTVDIIKSAVAGLATLTVATKSQAAIDAVVTAYQTTKNVLYGEYLLAMRAVTAQQIVFTAAETEAIVAAEGLNAAMAANPIGLVVTAIGALATAVYAYKSVTDEVTTSLGEEELKLKANQHEIEVMTESAMAAGEGTQFRKDQIQLLIDKYPEYFAGINKETVTNDELRAMLGKVNVAYQTRIDLARQAYSLENLATQQKALFEKEAEFFSTLPKDIQIEFGGNINKLVEVLDSGGAAAKKLKDQLNDTASGGAEFFGDFARRLSADFKEVDDSSQRANTDMQKATADRVKADIDAENQKHATIMAQLKDGSKAEEDETDRHNTAIAKLNGSFREQQLKENVDNAEKTKQVTLVSQAEISAALKKGDAETLDEHIKALDAQEKADIDAVNKVTVSRKISNAQLAALEQEAMDKILAIHADYNEKRKVFEDQKEILAGQKAANDALIQGQKEMVADAKKLDDEDAKNRKETAKGVADALKENEKEIQDARQKTTELNQETARIDEETRKKTIDGLVQMTQQMGGFGGAVAGFAVKISGDFDLISGKTIKLKEDAVASAQSMVDLYRTNQDGTELMKKQLADSEVDLAKANQEAAKTKSLTADSIFSIIQLGQQVLQTLADSVNAASQARMQALADALGETNATMSSFYDLARASNKEALDAMLADTTLSLQQRQDAVRAYYAEERKMATDQQRIQTELTYYQAIVQAAKDAGADVQKFKDGVAAADKARAESQAALEVSIIENQKDEAIQLATQERDAKLKALTDELNAYKAAKQAETDELNAQLQARKALESQNSTDDQLRLQADDVFRKQLMDAGEAREVAALEAAKQRELQRAKESNASAEEVSRITIAFDQLIADKHAEYQTAIGDKTKETSLANQEAKAEETDKIAALEAKTTAQINALKDQIALKDAQVNAQMTAANAAYNEAVRIANASEFDAKKALIVAELQAELAALRGKGASAAAINDLIAAINQITGQDNPYYTVVNTQYDLVSGHPEIIQRIIADGNPIRASDLGEIHSAFDQQGNPMTITFDAGGHRFTAYDANHNPIDIVYGTGFVPATGKTYFQGADYVDVGRYPKGRDTIPAMVNEGERILPTQQNLAIGGRNLTNDQLVAKLKGYDLFAQRYPQLVMPLPTAGGVLRMPDGILNAGGGNTIDLSEMVNELKALKQTIKNKKETSLQIDAQGWRTSERTVNSKTEYYGLLMNR